MPARIYRTEIAGCVRVGIECDSELELQEFLGRKGIVLINEPAVATALTSTSERRGRPSFDAAIAEALTAVEQQLADCNSVSARARLVLRHLAAVHTAEDLPSMNTVRAFLAERSPVAEKSANKSKRASIRRTGGR